MDTDVEAEVLHTADVLAQQAEVAALGQHLAQVGQEVLVLAAEVEQAFFRANRVPRDGHPFEYQVGRVHEDDPVLECARLALIGIANHILLLALGRSRQIPFHAGGESRAAASLETGSVDFGYYVGTPHINRLFETGIGRDRTECKRIRRCFHGAHISVLLDLLKDIDIHHLLELREYVMDLFRRDPGKHVFVDQ